LDLVLLTTSLLSLRPRTLLPDLSLFLNILAKELSSQRKTIGRPLMKRCIVIEEAPSETSENVEMERGLLKDF
jgi:hypothetical protein